jgi:acylphosphatase
MEHSAKDIYEMHTIIKGQVQEVGFRAMTRYYATLLGITGTVRNLAGGSVEIYAHGSKQRLEELMKKLKEEAFPGHIDEASIEFFPIETPHEDFRIIHSLNEEG